MKYSVIDFWLPVFDMSSYHERILEIREKLLGPGGNWLETQHAHHAGCSQHHATLKCHINGHPSLAKIRGELGPCDLGHHKHHNLRDAVKTKLRYKLVALGAHIRKELK